MRDWGVKLKTFTFENYPDKDCVDVDGSNTFVVDGLYAIHMDYWNPSKNAVLIMKNG